MQTIASDDDDDDDDDDIPLLETETDFARAYAVGFIAILSAAVGLLLWGINDEGLWLDEFFSVWIAEVADPREALHRLRADVHPPLYFMMLWAWIQAFGSTETALRALSALAYLLTLSVMIWGVRRLHGSRVAWIATLTMATSYQVLFYAREVRAYEWLLLAACVQTLAWLGLLRQLRSETVSDRFERGWVVLFVGGGLVASALHYYGALLSGVCCAALVLASFRTRSRPLRAATWTLSLTLGGACAVGVALWIAYSIGLHDKVKPGGFWIQRPDLTLLVRLGRFFAGTYASGAIILPLFAWAAVRAVSRVNRSGVRDDSLRPCIALLLIIGGLSFVSSFFVPTLTPRNLIVLLPAFWLAGAECLARALGRPRALAAGATIAVLSLTASAWVMAGPEKEQSREAVERAAQAVREDPNALVVVNSPANEYFYWEYYLRRRPELRTGLKVINDVQTIEVTVREAQRQGRSARVLIGFLQPVAMQRRFEPLRTSLARDGCEAWDGQWTLVLSCPPKGASSH